MSTSKLSQLEEALHINDRGCSNWYNIEDLEKELGFSLHGNGCALIQEDRGLGMKYILEKERVSNTKNGLVKAFRTTGFITRNKPTTIPSKIRREIKRQRCVICGTKHQIEADHKDGRKQPIPTPSLKDFQPLCKHCNAIKRERCSNCMKDNSRFDARTLHYRIGWIEGGEKFDPRNQRCLGCYYYSPSGFNSTLDLLNKS